MTQLEALRKRREEVTAMALDPGTSRAEALSILSCSTRALYAFMEEENITWIRKPHPGKNQFRDNPVERIQQNRDMAESSIPISDLYFNEDVEKLPL